MLFAHFSYCEQLTTDEILGVPYRQFYTIPYIFVKTLWQIFSHVRCFSFEPAEPLVEVLQLAVDGGQVPCQDLLHLLVDLNLASLQIETDRATFNLIFLQEVILVLPITLHFWFTCLSVHLVSNLL